MNLLLQLEHDNPHNTVITQPDGRQAYQFQTQEKIFRTSDTIISKCQNDSSSDQAYWQTIASIRRHTFHKDEVYFGEHPMHITQHTFFNQNVSFRAFDGREYKWKTEIGFSHVRLRLFDDNEQELASYQPPGFIDGLRGSLASLVITPAGFHIIDEIIVTFAFAEALRRERESQEIANSSAAINAAAAAANA